MKYKFDLRVFSGAFGNQDYNAAAFTSKKELLSVSTELTKEIEKFRL